MFTKIFQINLLELVHALEAAIIVFERMITDIFQLTVTIVHSLDKDTMQ